MTVDPRLPYRLFGPHAGLAAVLVVEVAIGFLLFQLAWNCMAHWRQQLRQDSGIAETHLLRVAPIGRTGSPRDDVARVAQALSRMEGVARVATTNQVPYEAESWNTQVKRTPASHEAIVVSTYFGDAAWLDTLGVRVLRGRPFHAGDYETLDTVWQGKQALPVIITRGLAMRAFGQDRVVGRSLFGPTRRLRVVAVIDRLPQPAGSGYAGAVEDSSLLLPVRPLAPEWTRYLVRVQPGQRMETVATGIDRWLAQQYPARPASASRRLADARPDTLQGERRQALLVLACAIAWWLLTLLSLGAAGYLWIQRGCVRISLHRALGASQAQIRRAVRLDHFFVAGTGLLLGALAARWLPVHLSGTWRMVALPSPAVAALVLVVLLCSQLIATWPARRAAAITPHGVTRKPWVRL